MFAGCALESYCAMMTRLCNARADPSFMKASDLANISYLQPWKAMQLNVQVIKRSTGFLIVSTWLCDKLSV